MRGACPDVPIHFLRITIHLIRLALANLFFGEATGETLVGDALPTTTAAVTIAPLHGYMLANKS
jgi:hypothetical protein